MIYKYPMSFARFYDTIYHSMRDTVDNAYFQNEIAKAGGKVLEVGAGTGRLFVNALAAGADIYGLDISETMLEVLCSKLPAEHLFRISAQNITGFTFGFKFELVIAPFRVIMHLLTIEEQLMAINNVYDHLNPGGRFIFDAFVPDLLQLKNGVTNQVDFDGEYKPGHRLRRSVSTKPDLINQVIEVNFHLEWEEDDETKHEDWKLPLRFFFRYELEHLVSRSKFKKFKIYGDYEGNELNSGSRDFLVICEKTDGRQSG
jgi:SAM-dependent methyltransferase